MPVNLNNKKFCSVANTENGDVDDQTVFQYSQQGDIVWASYSGGSVLYGNLLAHWIKDDLLEMRYQHLSTGHEFKTGQCLSRPEILANGKIRMHESWQWTSGDQTKGTSIIEEV